MKQISRLSLTLLNIRCASLKLFGENQTIETIKKLLGTISE